MKVSSFAMWFEPKTKLLGPLLAGAALVAAAGLAGCNPPPSQQESDQQIRQNAAKTTEQVKSDAKVAADEAKVATAEAGRKLHDIADGVRDGLHNGSSSDSTKPNAGRIDINSASQDELAALPGVSETKAKAIIDSRPYGSSHDLVSKGLLSESRYEHIADRITAR